VPATGGRHERSGRTYRRRGARLATHRPPVNYVFDERSQSALFRSALGSKLTRALDSAMAVFEIDGGDPVARTGWSVIIVGEPKEVTDRAEIDRLDDLELEPRAPGAKTHLVRIRTTSASGRRIVRTVDATPGDRR
jgi:hypothetical protein